jgi:hypothetical protein
MLEVVVEAGDIDQIGYATISNTGTLGAFTGATVPALSNATYDLDMTVDGGSLLQLAIALLSTDSWTGIAAKIQIALRVATSSTETVTITDGKIKISSVTNGAASSILIEAGTAGSGGGDLLAAIDAIGATYVTVIDAPVDGTEGVLNIPIVLEASTISPTKNFSYNYCVVSSAGTEKTGFTKSYDINTGYITLTEVVGTSPEFVAGDIVTIIGTFHI